MELKKIPESETFDYSEKCTKCKKKHLLMTQSDEDPEYYTDIFIQCDCGDYVKFRLPVN